MRITALGYKHNKSNNQQNKPEFKGGIIAVVKSDRLDKFSLMTHAAQGLIKGINGKLLRLISEPPIRRIILHFDKKDDAIAKTFTKLYNEMLQKGKTGIRFEFVEDDTLELILADLEGHWELN